MRSVHPQLSTGTLDAGARARVRAYDCGIHQTATLYTERGSHVSRNATSMAQMNDGTAGGSARSHNDD